jgi:2-polyprenyl-6-methoxyphenol hydroxylase-like FAD-dependent oxidoreductase
LENFPTELTSDFMRALVIGASVAGLLAARALSDFAESVILVDRDVPPDSPVARKGVPQGRHVHGVLAGGYDVLKSFFPGIVDDLTAEGARISDVAQDVLWFSNGAWRLRCKSGIVGCIQSRPFLEMHIRRRIAKLPNVQQLCNVSVEGFELDAPKPRVTGLRISANGGAEKVLPADLVLDCSGRGSRTPAWLEAAGLGKPSTTTVTVNVGYSTRFFRIPDDGHPEWHAMLILGKPPHNSRLGASFFVETGALQVTLSGAFRDYPPEDDAGFLKFAESLEHSQLFHTIRDATPTTPIVTYRFPAHVWHHYERLKSLPANLLVLGDALCSFNPIYGQGMTVAAQQARVLQHCLTSAKNGTDGSASLQRRYFRGASRIVSAAWAMATGADMVYPQAEGRRPHGQGAILRYLGHIEGLCRYDRKVLKVWDQVTNMQRPLSALFAPSIAARVMRHALFGAPAFHESQVTPEASGH